ncbi:MAG: serine hydrolase domain-containing protein [Pseudomonadota bacterium]
MKKQTNRIVLLFLIALFFLLSANTASALTPLQKKLNAVIHKAQTQFNINSVSLAVLLPGKTKPETFVAGTIARNDSSPISATTLFKVGSITKTYTATLIAKAIEENKLSLTDPLGKYLPQYPKWKQITVSELVNQTSGILDYDKTPHWWKNLVTYHGKVWTAKELVQLAYNSPAQFPPGQGWAYSNTNYILLGMIVEKVFNTHIPKLMNKLISRASLTHTFYYPTNNNKIRARLAHGYFMNRFDETTPNESWLRTAGAIVSTPSEMCTWMKTLFTKKVIPGLPISQYFDFIDTKTGKAATKDTTLSYSFGVFKRQTPEGMIYFTPGLTSGYVSMMVYVPGLDTYFAYSVSKAPIPGFHDFMLSHILKILQQSTAIKSDP